MTYLLDGENKNGHTLMVFRNAYVQQVGALCVSPCAICSHPIEKPYAHNPLSTSNAEKLTIQVSEPASLGRIDLIEKQEREHTLMVFRNA